MSEQVTMKYFSLEEISKNNGVLNDRIWIIINDNVYDVTDYTEHPGGMELVTEWAGRDATKAFNDFGHSGDAKRELKTYKIGEVIEDERKKKHKKTHKESEANKENKSPKNVNSSDGVIKRSCLSIITCGILA